MNRKKLFEISEFLRSNPRTRVEITGYATEDEGDGNLSKIRSDTVALYLVSLGIRRNRIFTGGRTDLSKHGAELIFIKGGEKG